MEINNIIREIKELPLEERFFIVEQALESIKKEELNHKKKSVKNDYPTDYSKSNRFKDFSVNEESLAEDWLSEEDKRWDNLL